MNAQETYKIFSKFYDDLVGQFDSDIKFYLSHCQKDDKIIEIGCGTGRILEKLSNLDYFVTGVDISEEMLDKASIKLTNSILNKKLTLINHDFTTKSLDIKFNKVLLSYYTFNYILDKPIDFLTNVYQILEPNSILLLDLFYPVSMFDNSIDNKWITKEVIADDKTIEFLENKKVIDNIETRQQVFKFDNLDLKMNTQRRYFSPSEIDKYLRFVGFTKVEFAYNYNYEDFREEIDDTKLKVNFIVRAYN